MQHTDRQNAAHQNEAPIYHHGQLSAGHIRPSYKGTGSRIENFHLQQAYLSEEVEIRYKFTRLGYFSKRCAMSMSVGFV